MPNLAAVGACPVREASVDGGRDSAADLLCNGGRCQGLILDQFYPDANDESELKSGKANRQR